MGLGSELELLELWVGLGPNGPNLASAGPEPMATLTTTAVAAAPNPAAAATFLLFARRIEDHILLRFALRRCSAPHLRANRI